jgi:hypothetical protein
LRLWVAVGIGKGAFVRLTLALAFGAFSDLAVLADLADLADLLVLCVPVRTCARFEAAAAAARFPVALVAFDFALAFALVLVGALETGFFLAGRLDGFACFSCEADLAAALLRTERTARVGAGAAAFKRFSTTGGVSSSPATRARAAPSDRAGAERREDGNAAPAADLLAFVFMAINVWGWRRTRTLLRLRKARSAIAVTT